MTENEEFVDFLSPDIKAEIQEFYDLAPDEVTDDFLDEELTLKRAQTDLRCGLMYSSLAEAARPNEKGEIRLKTRRIGGTEKRPGMYLTTRRWVWQAIECDRLCPRWKD